MAHEVETMAYAHAVPWHGLGVPVRPDMTPQEMLVAAGIDWKVEKRALLTGAAVGPDEWVERDPIELDNKFALCRATDGRVFDVVSGRWNPVQNRDVMEFFQSFCHDGGATLETAGALRGGEIVWGLANLGTGFVLPGGDAVKGYLLLTSRHKSGFATVARVTPVRVVCANTLALAESSKRNTRIRVPHTRVFDPVEAAEACGIAREGMSQFERNARMLQNLRLTAEKAIEIVVDVYQPGAVASEIVKDFEGAANRTVKGIIEAALKGAGNKNAGGPETGWGLLNGVTYYANHLARGTADSRFASITGGSMNAQANRVYDALLELAGAD